MNKSFSQLGKQLLGIWSQLGLNQRISVVLSTAVVLFGMLALAYWSSRTEYALLYGKLDEGEASKIVAALDEAKVVYQIRGAGSIWVPADKVYSLRMQMAAKGIPRGEGVGFEIFDKANFGISDFVQRANYIRAMQGELARTISQIDQVDSARVMIVMPENRLLMDAQRKPTASVFVHVKGSSSLSSSSVNSIRFLVANSVEGLQINNVSVVDNQGNVLSQNEESDSVAGLSNSQLTARKNLEQYLTKNVETMLEQVLGPGQAVVRVAADINLDSVTRTEEKYDPDGQVIRMSSINDEDTTTPTPIGSGSPGVASNSGADPSNTNAATLAVSNSHSRKKVTTSSYEINKITSNMVSVAGGIKHISCAVFIAQRFQGEGAERKPTPRTEEEQSRIRKVVQSALGIPPSSDGSISQDITVEEMAFNDQTGKELTKQFEKQQKWQFWSEWVQRLMYPALALGVLFMFWRLLRRTQSEEIKLGPLLSNGNGSLSKNGLPNRGVVTVEVLNQLIRENPGNMTQAVRSWLTKGQGES